jgi:hypothetical protein
VLASPHGWVHGVSVQEIIDIGGRAPPKTQGSVFGLLN